MGKYLVMLEVEDGKIAEILDRLERAREEIRQCFDDLTFLDAVMVKEKPPEETGGSSGQD